jgi:multisubunit Na+/H+ antiporter MnhG subunit
MIDFIAIKNVCQNIGNLGFYTICAHIFLLCGALSFLCGLLLIWRCGKNLQLVMHAASQGSTLGLFLTIFGVGFFYQSICLTVFLLFIAMLVLPISSHIICSSISKDSDK